MGAVMRRRKRGMTAAKWNAVFPVGTRVMYRPLGEFSNEADCRETRTRSEAWTLGHGATVVLIEDMAGGVDILHLVVLP